MCLQGLLLNLPQDLTAQLRCAGTPTATLQEIQTSLSLLPWEIVETGVCAPKHRLFGTAREERVGIYQSLEGM